MICVLTPQGDFFLMIRLCLGRLHLDTLGGPLERVRGPLVNSLRHRAFSVNNSARKKKINVMNYLVSSVDNK